MNKSFVARRRRLVVFGALVLLLLAIRLPVLRQIGRWLIVSEEPAPSELVVALGGESSFRVMKAAELLKAGYAERVAVSGPAPAFPDLEQPSYLRWLSILEQVGVPRDSVVLLVPSSSTYADGQRLREYVLAHDVERVLAVTDPYHTRRARWILRRVLGDLDIDLRMISADVPGTDPNRWWTDEHQFLWIFSEYLKFAYYLRHYGLWGPLDGDASAHRAER